MAMDEKKVDKPEKSEQVKSYFRGVKAENKKIIWPNRTTVLNYTAVVLFMSVLVSLIVFGLDFIFNSAVSKIVSP